MFLSNINYYFTINTFGLLVIGYLMERKYTSDGEAQLLKK